MKYTKHKIIKTSKSDPIERLRHWNPIIRKVYLSRYTTCFDLLELEENRGGGERRLLLELGIGSGFTLPYLSQKGYSIVGIDIHPNLPLVSNAYSEISKQYLTKADAYHLPFKDNTFDVVLAISILEHMEQLERVMFEIKRVLKQDKIAVFGIPVKNFVTDTWFWFAKSPALGEHHSHKEVINEVKRHFKITKQIKLPQKCPISYYIVMKCDNQ